MPRMTALHMLRSTMKTVSAPAISSLRGSLPHPTQQLCTLRVRRRRRLTQHSPPGGLLGPTWAGLAPADRASLLAPSFIRSPRRRAEQGRRDFEAERLAVCRLMTNSNLVGPHHRQVRRFLTLEDAAGVNAGLTIHVCEYWPHSSSGRRLQHTRAAVIVGNRSRAARATNSSRRLKKNASRPTSRA